MPKVSADYLSARRAHILDRTVMEQLIGRQKIRSTRRARHSRGRASTG